MKSEKHVMKPANQCMLPFVSRLMNQTGKRLYKLGYCSVCRTQC